MNNHNYGIVIHGGAGTILRSEMTDEKEAKYQSALSEAIESGYAALQSGATAVDAVTKAIISLENCPLFNAGKGSVFNSKGEHEMDASIMDGRTLHAGAVAAVKNIKNPIRLSQLVLSHSDHVLLVGDGAVVFGEDYNIAKEEDAYFYDQYRYEQWQKVKDTDKFQLDHSKDKKYLGTVGAVALDSHGNLAAGTSTGGMTNKKYGRIGDSALIGAGTYANNMTCAISCTGSGEYFMRAVTAYDISCLMEYKGLSLDAAAKKAIIDKLTALGGDGGIIGIDKEGNISMPFNCEGMYRAYQNQNGKAVLIYK